MHTHECEFTYFVFCLTTGPQRLPQRLFRRVRSGVSYFNLQYPLLSLRSNSSCLRFVPRPSVTFLLPSMFPSIQCLKGSSNARCDQSSKPSFSLLLEGYSSPLCVLLTFLHFSHDRSNWSSPEPHLKTFHVYCCILFYYVWITLVAGFWLEVSIRKVLRTDTSAQVFHGFLVSISEGWDSSQDSKLLLHASHVALPT